jgi:tetratricopeptide (TPR) repeat protein
MKRSRSFRGKSYWEDEMKRNFILSLMVALIASLAVPAAWGQLATIKGYVHDVEGNPMAGVTIQLTNKENGRKYELKTDKKGNYYSLAIASGRYDMLVLQDGKQIYFMNGITVQISDKENEFNIDLKKEQSAQQAAVPPEIKKQQEAQQKEALKVKGLNEKLAQADAAQQAGNFDQAIAALTEATQMDPTRDLLWFKLADYERLSTPKLASQQEKTERYNKAAEDYKKAIAIKPTGAYYNNLGEVQAKLGDSEAARSSYQQAAQIDPPNAGQYYYNEGAVLTNMGKVDDAISAFNKAIQIDPTKADAYYWKGINLLGKATMKGNKMEAPEGTAEAFNKYLELQPSGQFAEPAKQMLASIGAPVETSFGKGKTQPKTKK